MHRLKFVLILTISLILGCMMILSACQSEAVLTPTPTRTPGGPLDPGEVGTATPEPVAAAAATPFPIPEGPYGPDSYPADVNPLTGMPVSDLNVLNRSPLAIKVSNDPLARPQSGLSYADIIFEHYTEGGVTRFTSIFYSQAPDLVGSVRSGRLIDFEIVRMFDAVFSCSGFSHGVRLRLENVNWRNRNFSGPEYGDPYLVRIQREGLALEHTMFAQPEKIWALASDRGVNLPPNMTPGLAFRAQPNAGGTPASAVEIDFSTSMMEVRWDYNPSTGLYQRTLAGEPHIDYLTGQQLTASNVIAVAAMHVDTDILEDSYNGLWSIEIQLWGEGPASLFRDGQRIEGWWTRNDPEQVLQFTTTSGEVLYFRPGNTWFEIVPIGFDKLAVEP